MNTPIIVTPYGILISLLILSGFVALVFLCICLFKVIRLLGKINKFVDDNIKPVTESIQMMPEITENASAVCKNLNGITETAGNMIEGFDDAVGGSSNEGGGIFGTISFIASLVQNIVQVFKNLLGKDD
jgi:hypothetical protein